MDSNMEKESGKSDLMTRTVTCMRARMKMIRKTVLACSLGSRAIITRDVIKMTSATATERCTGKMARDTRASGIKAFKMA